MSNHFFSFQQALHVSVLILGAFMGSRLDWFPSAADKRLRPVAAVAAAVVAAAVLFAVVDIHEASLTAAAGNILLVENACLVVRCHASF